MRDNSVLEDTSMQNEIKASQKSKARNDRLTLKRSKFEENKLRDDFHELCFDVCREQSDAFVQCQTANGLLCVVKCRKELHAMNDCLKTINTDENFDDFKNKVTGGS